VNYRTNRESSSSLPEEFGGKDGEREILLLSEKCEREEEELYWL
jgi:hypothetical protein